MRRTIAKLCGLVAVLVLTACAADDPAETILDSGNGDETGGEDQGGEDSGPDAGGEDPSPDEPDGSDDSDGEVGQVDSGDDGVDSTEDADSGDVDLPEVDLGPPSSGEYAWEGVTCEPSEDAYAPDQEDDWPTCVADDGEWVQIGETVSTIARVGAFEDIADLLWRNDSPSPEDFLTARDLYATAEGLDSRVQRREDEHYPPVTDDEGTVLLCRDEGVPALDPIRCVGPGLILPIINEAFQEGIEGNSPTVQAARLEAALLWFLYVSTYKEATTCADVRADCDSSWAYYTGGLQRDEGIGLSAYVRASSPTTDDRVFDGILGVRCWRDVVQEEPTTNVALRDLARRQIDTALLNGLARVIADRLAGMAGHSGEAREADWAFLQILGPVLDREAAERDSALAADLAEFWEASSPDEVPIREVIGRLATVFPCDQ